MRAIIIDDEPLAQSVVKESLESFAEIELVTVCNDGFEGVKAINEHQPDLIFLDVQMPRINGFEMLELIDKPPAVIFTTAFDEYALKAFDNHAVDYLLKPFSKERFDKAIVKFLDQTHLQKQQQQTNNLLQSTTEIPGQAERVVIKTAGKIKIIPINSIHYFEASDDYVKIFTPEGSFLKNKTMAYFEKSLPADRFARTHRSYIVNVNEITRIEPYEKENHLAVLRSGAKVPVSQSGYAKLRMVLGL